MSEKNIPIKAIKSLNKSAKRLKLTEEELSGCKLALIEMSKNGNAIPVRIANEYEQEIAIPVRIV